MREPLAIVGSGARMHAIREFIALNAFDMTPLAILGEPGTGRSFVARALHERRHPAGARFTLLSASGLTRERLTTEMADEGTVVVRGLERADETMAWVTPAPDGSARARLVLIADADRTLAVGPLRIVMPPLRARLEDIAALTDGFLAGAAHAGGRELKAISPSARQALEGYDWPGNLRELRQTCEWISRTCSCDWIRRGCLPARLQRSLVTPAPADSAPRTGLDDQLRDLEGRLITRALMETGHNRSKAARLLSIKRSTLGDRIQRLGLVEQISEDVA